MTDFEGTDTKKSRDFQLGEDLSSFSVDELVVLTRQLKYEISRVDGEIKKKQSSLNTAESIFSKK